MPLSYARIRIVCTARAGVGRVDTPSIVLPIISCQRVSPPVWAWRPAQALAALHIVLPVCERFVVIQPKHPDGVAADDVVFDQLRRLLTPKIEPDGELAGVFDVRLGENLERR